MVYATVFLHYPFTMADGEERENRGKDDGRKTSTRKSSGDTKISAPESESSVVGAAIINSTTSSET